MGKEEVINIQGLTRDFALGSEKVKVLKGIDLTVYKGEYVALMGPSGSGKSTLMNILGCLDTPTSGAYYLKGDDVSNMSESQLADVRNREIGFVFQTFNLMPRLNAQQNVALPMIYSGVSPKERTERASTLKSAEALFLIILQTKPKLFPLQTFLQGLPYHLTPRGSSAWRTPRSNKNTVWSTPDILRTIPDNRSA